VDFFAKSRHRKTSFLTTTRHEMSGRPGKFGTYGDSRNQLLEQAVAMRSNPLTSVLGCRPACRSESILSRLWDQTLDSLCSSISV
jgi:hypothetical protein